MSDEHSDMPRPVAFSAILARARRNADTAATRGWVKQAAAAQPTRCPHCMGMGYLMGRDAEYARARLCECREDCPSCGGARYRLEEEGGYEVATPCECAGFVARIRAYNDAQIPAGYAEKEVTLFVDRGLENLKRAKEAVLRYRVAMIADDMKGLVLLGGLGLGKTHLVCGILSYFTLERGIGCRFIDYSDLMARIRATFDDGAQEKASSIIEALVQTPVLAIDDLGKGQGTNWELSILDQVVTRRYNARRIILATTNYLPDELLERRAAGGGPKERRRRDLNESLEERIGDRLVSRLRAACDFHVLEGTDYRVEKARDLR
jgi:DNA replication protein DnaC